MTTASQMIEQLGGSAAAARKLGLPFTTVDSWKRKNRIPRWRIAAVETALAESHTA